MTAIQLDWNSIRPLNGGRDKGFEEICAQLARAECSAGSTFVRKGTPDAGVECYSILGDGSEWAWQSKYFDSIDDSQWSQIDESISRALEKHPRLVRYHVCVPWDLPDGRIKGRKSAKDRWDEHVVKWSQWAADRGMTVQFVYWGSHEMLERLTDPKHAGRVQFWFGVRSFDGAWFSKRLDEAIRTVGPRYTPEINVDLPIAGEFEAFGRSENFFNGIKSLAISIRKNFRTFISNKVSGILGQEIQSHLTTLESHIRATLEGLAGIEPSPMGDLPFAIIAQHIAAADAINSTLEELLQDLSNSFENDSAKETPEDSTLKSTRRENHYKSMLFSLYNLSADLKDAKETLDRAEKVATSKIMLIRGDAGTGKTHLLCDVGSRRLKDGKPTIILLGQRFIGTDSPWVQALQQIDLANLSTEEFVGAIEASAQAANSRALLFIDAINEGAGRLVWPNHLSAFLAPLERSQWIGTVISVRSSYQESVVPDDISKKALVVTHQGFFDNEYDATRTFFLHYGLELPSTPLLAPEFRNPLFLKTLCVGLNAKGERRLPRGFHGISAVFDLYLSTINARLAGALGFDQRFPLVRRALEAFALSLVDAKTNWLSLEVAARTVNSILPDREYERSLYRGLVVEGLLVEDISQTRGTDRIEIVFIGYERFSDHLIASALLDKHLDNADPAAAFSADGALPFLNNNAQYVASGLLEALLIQVAEHTGQELITINPELRNRPGIRDAFLQSIIWRDYSAFSAEAHKIMDWLVHSEHGRDETFATLITIATLPDHPFNANYLGAQLRGYSMADRDACWSIYLHKAWNTHGPVDRLVDWASMVQTNGEFDDRTLDLCATTLAWMLSTSNRYLRDRATKALLALLSGHVSGVQRLVESFADVDDPYIVERVLAVAYGVATASNNQEELGELASSVFSLFFADTPPAHVLSRDYARGVIEKAIFVGIKVEFDITRIRPPYQSQWPAIPSDHEIKPFLEDWSRGSHDGGGLEWSRNIISSSVMNGDFARYVIGTNSSTDSRHWLSLKLSDPPWQRVESPEDLQAKLMSEFSSAESQSLEDYTAACRAFQKALGDSFDNWLIQEGYKDTLSSQNLDNLFGDFQKDLPSDLIAAEANRTHQFEKLKSALTPNHLESFVQIQETIDDGDSRRKAPRFDLRQMQRYILHRVFELGWTVARFGYFDRFDVRSNGREAAKAERIGKKYQWIAYHEILALISDHFQYMYEGEIPQAFEGPWQGYFRDIDPTCTLSETVGGTSWGPHTSSWWSSSGFVSWGFPTDPAAWTANLDDFPDLRSLLVAENPDDQFKWINAHCSFSWQQSVDADKDRYDVERRELYVSCVGFFLRKDDVQAFMKWAATTEFDGWRLHDVATNSQVFLGEYGWAPAFRFYSDGSCDDPFEDCPVSIKNAAVEYQKESKGFDCSVNEGYKLNLPSQDLLINMGLSWTGRAADFADYEGRLTAFDPTALSAGPSSLLLREDALRTYLDKQGLELCWMVNGEKRVLAPGLGRGLYNPPLSISGVLGLGKESPYGFLKFSLEQHRGDSDGPPSITIKHVGGGVDLGPNSEGMDWGLSEVVVRSKVGSSRTKKRKSTKPKSAEKAMKTKVAKKNHQKGRKHKAQKSGKKNAAKKKAAKKPARKKQQ